VDEIEQSGGGGVEMCQELGDLVRRLLIVLRRLYTSIFERRWRLQKARARRGSIDFRRDAILRRCGEWFKLNA